MKKLFLIVFIMYYVHSFGQPDFRSNTSNVKVAEASGDLNGDRLSDLVIVTQDTADETGPYQLQVLLRDKAGSLKLHLTTGKTIQADYPHGRDGYITGTQFGGISIKNGELIIAHELTRGHREHKFRYRDGSFVLTGYYSVNSDGQGRLTTIHFDLLACLRTERVERYDTEKVLSVSRKRVRIRPLPKLKDFIPFEGDIY